MINYSILINLRGYNEFIKEYKKEDVNKIENGYNLLQIAISAREFNIAKMLIEDGIDVNYIDNDGNNILHYLFEYIDTETECIIYDITKEVLSRGCSLKQKNIHGNNPLWVAVHSCKGKYFKIFDLIVDYDYSLEEENKYGRSVEWQITQRGYKQLFDVFNIKYENRINRNNM